MSLCFVLQVVVALAVRVWGFLGDKIPAPSQKKHSRKPAQMVLPFPPFFTTYFWVLKLSLPVGWDNTGFAFRAVVGEAISIIFCWDLPGK